MLGGYVPEWWLVLIDAYAERLQAKHPRKRISRVGALLRLCELGLRHEGMWLDDARREDENPGAP